MELTNEVRHDLTENLLSVLDESKLDGQGRNIIVSHCPFCGHAGYKYGIYVGVPNKRKVFGSSNCFSCGRRFRTLSDTLKALGQTKLMPKETVELDDDENEDELHLFEDEIDDTLVEVAMPKGYKRTYKNQYLRSRGWRFEDFEFFEAGTNRGMDRKLEDYVILPVIDGGKYVGWVARHTWSKDDIDDYNASHRFQIRRYLNSDERTGGNGFSKLLYNIDAVKKYETEAVILCEGAFDVVGLVRGLLLYENTSIVPVCTFGKKISDIQIFKLQDKGVKTVILGYDADEAGRSAIHKVANDIDPYFDTYVAAIPDGMGKDFGDMSQSEIYDVFANHILTPREFFYGG